MKPLPYNIKILEEDYRENHKNGNHIQEERANYLTNKDTNDLGWHSEIILRSKHWFNRPRQEKGKYARVPHELIDYCKVLDIDRGEAWMIVVLLKYAGHRKNYKGEISLGPVYPSLTKISETIVKGTKDTVCSDVNRLIEKGFIKSTRRSANSFNYHFEGLFAALHYLSSVDTGEKDKRRYELLKEKWEEKRIEWGWSEYRKLKGKSKKEAEW